MSASSGIAAAKSYHHGDLRAALIAAALAMLEDGIEPSTLSLREAARRAGVSAMAPYRHFADKDALLAAVATVGFERLMTALRSADVASPGEAIVAQGVAYVAFACAKPALFRLMFGAALATRHGTLAVASDAAFDVLARRVAEIAAPAGAADLALKYWATAHGLASLAVDGQLPCDGETPTAVAARILKQDLGAPSG